MPEKIFNVLFLCTGNSARSILAEALLRRLGRGRFQSYSGGSAPKGRVNPFAIELLVLNNFSAEEFRSKSWDEFSGPNAPLMDFVFTVCDRAANETCPAWPGQPMTAHWGVADPDRPDLAEAEQRRLFMRTYTELDSRIKIFTSLPLEGLERIALQEQLDQIGRM